MQQQWPTADRFLLVSDQFWVLGVSAAQPDKNMVDRTREAPVGLTQHQQECLWSWRCSELHANISMLRCEHCACAALCWSESQGSLKAWTTEFAVLSWFVCPAVVQAINDLID